MLDRFAAARLKIERANKHIADLNGVVSTLPDRYLATVERHENIRSQQITYFAPDAEKITAAMALLFGDAVHNLRVAVEYAWLGAVEKHIPEILKGRPHFPTGQTRKDVENRLKERKIHIRSPRLFDGILANIKPYIDGGNYFLKLLHDLDISDKHWLFIPLVRNIDVNGIIVEDEKGIERVVNARAVASQGTFAVRFPLEYAVKNNGKLTLEVVFDEIDIPLLKGLPITSDLKEFLETTVRTVERFNII